MIYVVTAMAMGVMAEITNTVNVTKFHQSFPYSGKATIEYTIGGTLPVNAVAEITLNTDNASATFTQKNVVTGANTNVIDFASSFGGVLLLTNASFVVTITEDLGGVQLWENGPYWAECNVGATKPEESGYYFWWGDTVGYTRSGGTWTEDYYTSYLSGYYSYVTWVSSKGAQMSSSPFSSCPTDRKNNSALQSAGYIDSTDNLVAEHDAATEHLGSPWRMPAHAEFSALTNNCAITRITTNGVSGRLVTGKGAYANRSIFLPAAGYGYGSRLYHPDSDGCYWSSTPDSGDSTLARELYFTPSGIGGSHGRNAGLSVRPVRGFAEGVSVVGIVTCDLDPTPATPVISPVSGTTFDGTISVTIACSTEGATIHYTTDGSEPTEESPVYRRFRISGKTTVKAIAEKYGILSGVAVAEYAKGWCADPVVEATASFTGSKTKVAISCNTEGAAIRYTLNGSVPNSYSTRYTGPFYVTDSCTVKAYATTPDYFDSAVVTQVIKKVWGIGDTMGKPDHGFSTIGSGGLGWTRVVDATAPGGEAMKSGAITHNQSSILSTTVMGPGTLSFAWRTSCEDDPQYEWDHVECAVDSTVVCRLCGETAWQNESVTITGDGEHVVEWRYVKDEIENEGEDAAWVTGYNWVSVYTATRTTEVPVPYVWLEAYDPDVVDEYDAYEASAKATAANGNKVWECYVAGTDPMDANSQFRAFIEFVNGRPTVTWSPNLNTNGTVRAYTIWGSTNMVDRIWMCPTNSGHRFFKVTVEMP